MMEGLSISHLIMAGTSCASPVFSVRAACRQSLLPPACLSKERARARSAPCRPRRSSDGLRPGATFRAAAAAAAAPAGARRGMDAPEPKPRMGCPALPVGGPCAPRNSGPAGAAPLGALPEVLPA